MSCFALDENFPFQVVDLPWPPAMEVKPLVAILPEAVGNSEDWELLLGLDAAQDVAALVTNDANILNSPREMLALSLTSLGLIVTAEVGDNPLKATGLLMIHLPEIAFELGGRPKTWRLRPTQKVCQRPVEHLARIARMRNQTAEDLIESEVASLGSLLSEPYGSKLSERWGTRAKVKSALAVVDSHDE